MSTALGDAARSSGLSFAGSLTSAVAGFVLSVVLARMLGPAGSGIVFQLISVFMITGAVAKLGFDTTAVWLLPRLSAGSRGDVRRATGMLLWGSLIGGAVAGVVLLALAPVIGGDSGDLVVLIRASAVFMPLFTLSTVALAVTRGLGGVRDYVLIGSIGLPVGRLIAIAAALAVSATAIVAGGAWLAVLILATVFALLAVVRVTGPFKSAGGAPTLRGVLMRRITAFSAPRTLSSGIEQSLTWLDVLLVGLLAGPAAAGVYGVVSRLVQSGTIPSTSMRIVVAPQFSRMLHEERGRELDELYTRTAQWIVLFSMPIYVLLSILGEPILVVFGPGFTAGATALAVMCIGAVVSACTGNVQSLLLMSGRSGWAAINKIIVLAVIVGLLVLLVPPYGIVGAAIASTAAVSLDAILASVQIRLGVGLRSNIAAVLAAALVAGLATAVPAVAVRLLLGPTIPALVVGAVGALVVWAAALYLTRRRFALDQAAALLRRKRQ